MKQLLGNGGRGRFESGQGNMRGKRAFLLRDAARNDCGAYPGGKREQTWLWCKPDPEDPRPPPVGKTARFREAQREAGQMDARQFIGELFDIGLSDLAEKCQRQVNLISRYPSVPGSVYVHSSKRRFQVVGKFYGNKESHG